MAVTPLARPSTSTGVVLLSSFVPLPSWPPSLRPQHLTPPRAGDRAGVVSARGDRDDPAREAGHVDWRAAIGRCPVPELATLIGTPTFHPASTGQSARVAVASGDGRRLVARRPRCACDDDRCGHRDSESGDDDRHEVDRSRSHAHPFGLGRSLPRTGMLRLRRSASRSTKETLQVRASSDEPRVTGTRAACTLHPRVKRHSRTLGHSGDLSPVAGRTSRARERVKATPARPGSARSLGRRGFRGSLCARGRCRLRRGNG